LDWGFWISDLNGAGVARRRLGLCNHGHLATNSDISRHSATGWRFCLDVWQGWGRLLIEGRSVKGKRMKREKRRQNREATSNIERPTLNVERNRNPRCVLHGTRQPDVSEKHSDLTMCAHPCESVAKKALRVLGAFAREDWFFSPPLGCAEKGRKLRRNCDDKRVLVTKHAGKLPC
jgi:hypothetical protein